MKNCTCTSGIGVPVLVVTRPEIRPPEVSEKLMPAVVVPAATTTGVPVVGLQVVHSRPLKTWSVKPTLLRVRT